MCATRSPSSRSTPAPRRWRSRCASATSAPAAGGCSPSRLLRLERQGAAVDAVALPVLARAVVEDVAQMGVAVPADDLGPPHEATVVGSQLDVLEIGGLGEARPAGARVELGVGGEQLGAAADAAVHARGLLVDIGAGEGALGAGLAGHLVLLGRELVAPLLLALLDLRRHLAPFGI